MPDPEADALLARLHALVRNQASTGTPELVEIMRALVAVTRARPEDRAKVCAADSLEVVGTVCRGALKGFLPESDTGLVAAPGRMWSSPHRPLFAQLALEGLRVLRNCLAQGTSVQTYLCDCGILEEVLELTDFLTVIVGVEIKEDEHSVGIDQEQCRVLLNCALLVLANACVNNPANQAVVFDHLFPVIFLRLLAAESPRKTIAFASLLLHNCLAGNAPRCRSVVDHPAPLPAPSVPRLVAGACVVRAARDEDPAMEWLVYVVQDLCAGTSPSCVLRALGAVDEERGQRGAEEERASGVEGQQEEQHQGEGAAMLSQHQIIFCNVVREIADARPDAFEMDDDFLRAAVQHIPSALRVQDLESDDAAVKTAAMVQWEQLRTLLALVATLSSVPARAPCPSHSPPRYQQQLTTAGALRRVVRLLPSDKVPPQPNTAASPLPASPWVLFGLASDAMRLVANLVFRHHDNQELAREEGAIPAVLAHCHFDDDNPQLREWSVFALRNLMENEANQQVLRGMTAQGVAKSEELDMLGLRAVLTPEGKVRLQKKEKAEGEGEGEGEAEAGEL